MESDARTERWKGYFEKLLNSTMPTQPLVHNVYERAKPQVVNVSLEEVKIAISCLKKWKAPGTDDIPAELIKYGGKELHIIIFRLCQLIWNKRRVLETWDKAIIISLLNKKGDKTKCDIYRRDIAF